MDSVRAEIRVHLAVYIPFRIPYLIIVWNEDTDLDGIFVSSFFLWRESALYIVQLSLSTSNINLVKITVEHSILIFAK